MKIEVIDEQFTVAKLPCSEDAFISGEYVFTGVTDNEVSLVCPSELTPSNVLAREDGWSMFRVGGTMEFSMVGVLSKISGALAGGNVSLFAVSTFDTDYILVKEESLDRALQLLAAEGFLIATA